MTTTILIIAGIYLVMAGCWHYEVILCEMNGDDNESK